MAVYLDPRQLSLWAPVRHDPRAPVHLEMPGADVRYYTDFLSGPEAAEAFAALYESSPWKQDQRRMYDRMLDVPRLSVWYDEDDQPWHPTLTRLRERIEAVTGFAYDRVLLNLYRDGRDSVAWHRDDVDRYGQDEIIASLSLGATRRFMFRPRPGKPGTALALDLPAGSLLLMGPGSQMHWEHCVPKTHRPVGPRINLTFRRRVGL